MLILLTGQGVVERWRAEEILRGVGEVGGSNIGSIR